MRQSFWFVFLLFLASCFNQGDCLINSTNLAKVELFDKTDGNPKLTKFLRITQLEDNLELIQADSTATVSSFQLPLSPHRTESTFVFLTSDSATYRLGLKYHTFVRVLAVDCGAYQYFDELAADSTNFTTIKIVSPQLFTSVENNLEIYF